MKFAIVTSVTAYARPAYARNVRATTDLKARPRGFWCSEAAIAVRKGRAIRPGGP